MKELNKFWQDLSEDRYDGLALPSGHQGADGVGHFNFYSPERQLSFQWDGKMQERITVSYGGYGEPARWAFVPTPFDHQDVGSEDITEAFALYFQRMCNEWIDYCESAL